MPEQLLKLCPKVLRYTLNYLKVHSEPLLREVV
nr:MAG TPA: hypothetical protein [Caudoviricetes sp.]